MKAGRGIPTPASILCLLVLGVLFPCGGRADMHLGWHQRFKQGPKMDITAATFFGGAGSEEFLGVTVAPDESVVVAGNSWQPPLPTDAPTEVLGADGLWSVALHAEGKERDEEGNLMAPRRRNPNRTGFLVFYSPDLRKIRRVVRFGWGVASITAVEYMSDNSLIIAGLATRNFRPVAEKANLLKVYPQRRYEAYGPYEYDGVSLPGDVYVAKLNPDLKGFAWVWIFEGHRVPPTVIHEGPNCTIVCECRTLRSITPDGQEMREVMKFMSSGSRNLLAVSPVDGRMVIGGEYSHPTGREPWRKPYLDLYNAEGKPHARFYEWQGPLVGADNVRLVSDSAVRGGTMLPNNDVLLYIWSDGGNTVGAWNPVDFRKPLHRSPVCMSMAGADVGSFCHLVRFNLDDYNDTAYTLFASVLQFKPNSVRLSRLCAARDGRVMIMGKSAGFLVQTTTRWFRATDHHEVHLDADNRVVGIKLDKKGWPHYLGLGGREDFSAVFSPSFSNVLWSSATAHCEHEAMRETGRGIVAVSVCLGADRKDGETPYLKENHIAGWRDFLGRLKTQGESATPSPGRQLWGLLTDEMKKAVGVQSQRTDPEDEFPEAFYAELNRILVEGKTLYDPAAWKDCEFSHYEMKLIGRLKAGAIGEEELPDLNRRLIEKGFPDHVYAYPKSNRPPVLNAVQDEFGGGYSDGHVYLLEAVK